MSGQDSYCEKSGIAWGDDNLLLAPSGSKLQCAYLGRQRNSEMADCGPAAPDGLPQELVLGDPVPKAKGHQVCEGNGFPGEKTEGEELNGHESPEATSPGPDLQGSLIVHGSEMATGQPGLLEQGNGLEDGQEILCDFCMAQKVLAVKSCLTCMVNYCEDHLRPHLENSKLRSHKLMDPAKDIDLQTCETHKGHLGWFCQTDLVCVCEECLAEEHKGHNLLTCEAARKDNELVCCQYLLEK
ncbi:unnamed protein product, partial [Natator depressus]